MVSEMEDGHRAPRRNPTVLLKALYTVSGESCCYPLDEVGYHFKEQHKPRTPCGPRTPESSDHGSLVARQGPRQRHPASGGRRAV